MKATLTLTAFLLLNGSATFATTYTVGPASDYTNIGDVAWESLSAGDSVLIHYRPEPYHEKWVVCARGTESHPITISGVPDPQGRRPIIDGRNATTRPALNYWNEPRGIIKIGGANRPADTMPSYVTIENLHIRSGRPPYEYTGRDGVEKYGNNAAAIFIEKGEHIIVRNCVLTDCGNGLFCASQSSDVLIEYCEIRDNGIEGRIYEHNSYTEARGITFQFNHYGPLRKECQGNNLKDRSAGTVIRYNWIEDGNRQLDLVDSDHGELIEDPAYRTTHVYGNILVEGDGQGNSQIVHYGGDSHDLTRYRKGTLYFYNNTVVSTRSDRTTLFRLSSQYEACEAWNNIFFVNQPGNRLAISNADGRIRLSFNWLSHGWVPSHETLAGTVTASETNLTGTDPGFVDATGQFRLEKSSPCVDAGLTGNPAAHPLPFEYRTRAKSKGRSTQGTIDLGAFEFVE
jgi:hypothetical protein